jgi:hypothetical protein
MLKYIAAAWDEQHIKRDSNLQTAQQQFLEYFSQLHLKKR